MYPAKIKNQNKCIFLNIFINLLIFSIQKSGFYKSPAFDHYISQYLFIDCPSSVFASNGWLQHYQLHEHVLNQRLAIAYQQMLLSSDASGPSAMMQRAIQLDKQLGCFYFARPEEVCARSFESMLMQQRLKNAFLVSGCTAPAHWPSPYLQSQELPLMAERWLGYFQALGQQLQHKV